MLVEIGNKIVSTQLFERKFVCDLNTCKGACCIEGDAGAPLTDLEINILEEELDHIKPFMREVGIKAVEESGVFYIDQENETATTLVNKKECAFVFFDEKGITKCAIEAANKAKKTTFKKPISCHLYPIRVKHFDNFTALNYNQWDICESACDCGEKLNVPVYKFLKEPLTRAFGEAFFNELEIVNEEVNKERD
ncbi:MAG: DUF3109 family protein [Crocinitomicaceae bacterium]